MRFIWLTSVWRQQAGHSVTGASFVYGWLTGFCASPWRCQRGTFSGLTLENIQDVMPRNLGYQQQVIYDYKSNCVGHGSVAEEPEMVFTVFTTVRWWR